MNYVGVSSWRRLFFALIARMTGATRSRNPRDADRASPCFPRSFLLGQASLEPGLAADPAAAAFAIAAAATPEALTARAESVARVSVALIASPGWATHMTIVCALNVLGRPRQTRGAGLPDSPAARRLPLPDSGPRLCESR